MSTPLTLTHSHLSLLTPQPSPFTPHSTPHPSLLTTHPSLLTRSTPQPPLLNPHPSLLTPHSSTLTPHHSPLTPHSTPRSTLNPHSSPLTPHSSLLTPHSSPGQSRPQMQSIHILTHHALHHLPLHEARKCSVGESGHSLIKPCVCLHLPSLLLQCPHATWPTEVWNPCMRQMAHKEGERGTALLVIQSWVCLGLSVWN